MRTPGRSRAGYVVYLAYQLVESVTYSQVMLDTVFYAVDIEVKKKQVTFPLIDWLIHLILLIGKILHQLGDLKLSPAVDDRIRKQVKEVKEFMAKEQVDLLHQIKEIKEPSKLGVVLQFVQV